ncbi:MAG: ADP/ATP-dependent (S)-NAD(P)H-hydrate dehydratase, partial [Patescibacteria group bacterium]
EVDCVLIGPGLPRPDGMETGDDSTKELTERLLLKFPNKKWVIDGGSLQVIEPESIPKTAIITPNAKEFEMLFGERIMNQELRIMNEMVSEAARRFGITVLLKGPVDIVCSPEKCLEIKGGNAGMTKGGTGDVLAGLTAAFYAKNGAFLSATCASFINKKAGESLFDRVGLYFNASDLVNEIPVVMREYI